MKRQPSSIVLMSVLGVLVVAIIGLTIGVVVVKNKKTETVAYEEPVTEKVEIETASATELCEVIEAGVFNSTEEEYEATVEEFEEVETAEMRESGDYRSCYVSLRNYYAQVGDEEKEEHYNEIVLANIERNKTDEERQQEKELEERYRKMAEEERNS